MIPTPISPNLQATLYVIVGTDFICVRHTTPTRTLRMGILWPKLDRSSVSWPLFAKRRQSIFCLGLAHRELLLLSIAGFYLMWKFHSYSFWGLWSCDVCWSWLYFQEGVVVVSRSVWFS